MRRLFHVPRQRLLGLLVALAVFAALVWCAPASAGPPAHASAAPSASSARAEASGAGEVRVHDTVIVTLRAARAGRSAAERARSANAALDALLAHPEQLGDVRATHVSSGPEATAVVYVGETPVLTIGPEDAAASGEASAAVLAGQITTRLSDVVSKERKRTAIATTVFSLSLLVFSALIALFLLGRVSDAASRLRKRVFEEPDRVAGVRLGNIEFMSPGAARGAASIALTLGHRLLQVAIAYGWLIFGLSLFEATRGYTERLTGMVLKPLSGLAARIGGALPLVLIAGIGVLAVTVLVRFVGLFFDSVARGDTRIAWLPKDLARPTSALVRFGMVVIALVLASPMITGESDGALSRLGLVALLACALAATPVLASAAVGFSVVFGRRVRPGDHVELGGRAGRVLDVTLLDVRLEDATLAEVSVPHILGLFHAARVHKHGLLSSVEVVVDARAPQADVEAALLEAARKLSARGSVELLSLDGRGARWRVTSALTKNELSLAAAVQGALADRGIALGGARATGEAAPEET